MRQSAATASGLPPVPDDGSEKASPVFVENGVANGEAEKGGEGEARRERLPPADSVPALSVSGKRKAREKESAAPYCGE